MSSEPVQPASRWEGPAWKYAALLSYVGTRYCGWQKQKGSAAGGEPSIQETIERALSRIVSEDPVSVVGSGRTDSGVHAMGQVAHFFLKRKEWDPGVLQRGLNSLLSSCDIQVLGVRRVPDGFHAQRSAFKKQYSYYFQQGPCAIPAFEPYSWWIKRALNRDALQKALDFLKGEHDFKPFQASGAKPGRTTVREILEAEATFEEIAFPGITPLDSNTPRFLRIRLVGTGFLKQMVRGIAGTLLQIGEGRRPPECIREILETGDRNLVGPTAPSRALWLERVWYKSGLDWSQKEG